jgi:hypothetical protein
VSRKRIWYWIDAPPGLCWVSGEAAPVPYGHPSCKRGFSNVRTALTMKQAMRVAARCLPGTTVARFMNVYGKRQRRYELARYDVSGTANAGRWT